MTEFGEAMAKFLDNRVGTFGITTDGHFRCGNTVYEDARIVSWTHTDPLGTFHHRQALVPCGEHTVSVAWGTHNYGENKGREGDTFDETPMSAEVAVMTEKGDFVPFDNGDDVKGHQSVGEVNALLASLRS